MKVQQGAAISAGALLKERGQRKYRNEPIVVEGERFDSKREYRRWCDLKVMEQAGEIVQLRRQTRWKLIVGSVLVCTYVDDFDYMKGDTGERVVEDIKSPITAKNPVYRLKRKLMKACYDIDVAEVY